MDSDIFFNISKILERDSKTTTYKFALLRGVIDIIQENSPFINCEGRTVRFPTGLLIEKWLLYYYPILESEIHIPQINGSSRLAFENQFKYIINCYRRVGGFSAFYNDLKNTFIPEYVEEDLFLLLKKLRDTITNMPMKYIGQSVNNHHYSIFTFKNNRVRRKTGIDLQFLIEEFGSFSIPKEYYEAFRFLGSFINGQDSVLFKWAEFSVNASGKILSTNQVLNEVLKNPITERNALESKKLYKNILKQERRVFCVWTGEPVQNYDIDHVIPFSVWKNNDLWNLLPASSTTNNQKRDKIPLPNLIEKRKSMIIDYWEMIDESQTERFRKEFQLALLGNSPFDSWQEKGIKQLQETCEYLISKRGYQAWEI